MIRVLVVEDSNAVQKFLGFALSTFRDCQVEFAGDGIEALKLVSVHHYQVILLDLNLPLMDGMKVLSRIRQRDAGAATPVIVISTESSEETRGRMAQLGVSQFLPKPVQAYQVRDAVRAVLELPTPSFAGHEQRKIERLEIPVTVVFEDELPTEMTTWDISPHGAFLACHTPKPEGALATILIRLPHLSEPFRVRCEVVHVRNRSTGPHRRPPGFGVRFVHETAENCERMEAAFRSLAE